MLPNHLLKSDCALKRFAREVESPEKAADGRHGREDGFFVSGFSQPVGRFALVSSFQGDGNVGFDGSVAQRVSISRVNGVVHFLLAKESSDTPEACLSSEVVFMTRRRRDVTAPGW